MSNPFPLSTDDCELLLRFEENSSLVALAERMGRDHSVVTRSLKRIADLYPVVEKKAGKWVLTDLGKRVNDVSRGFQTSLVGVLNEQTSLRIGSNREFAARILGAELKELQSLFPKTKLIVNSYEKGTETALLQGQIDLGIDCDRPFDPGISYKLVVDEPIILVASPKFAKAHRKEINDGQLFKIPHLLCDRVHPDKILARADNQMAIAAQFNDIATARTACLAGVGWALLPAYAVRAETESGALVQLDPKTFGKSKYGVWWPRSRPDLKDAADIFTRWLAGQKL